MDKLYVRFNFKDLATQAMWPMWPYVDFRKKKEENIHGCMPFVARERC